MREETMNDENLVRIDRMRYTKNKLSSTMAYIAIIADVLYFINVYQSDVKYLNTGDFYYHIIIGASVICNLLFLLATFLCEEGVKNYKDVYAWGMLVLAVVQIVRIFILPAKAVAAGVMPSGQHVYLVAMLILSAASLVVGAIVSIIRGRELSIY